MDDRVIYILTLPKMDAKDYTDLITLLRPISKKFNILVTPLDVKPVNIEEFKSFANSLAETAKSYKVPEIKLEPENPIDDKIDMAIKEKAVGLLKAVPPSTIQFSNQKQEVNV